MSKRIESTLDSREVAKMLNKRHTDLMRDVRRYIKQFNESNLASVEFFKESTYTDDKGEIRPCYQITKKGCEFIAHKLTGTKGTEFTAKYINRFHEMKDVITGQQLQLSQEQIAVALLESRKLLEEKDKLLKEKDRRIKELEMSGPIRYDETFYRQEIQRYSGIIGNRRRLSQIYTIAKCLYEAEQKKVSAQ